MELRQLCGEQREPWPCQIVSRSPGSTPEYSRPTTENKTSALGAPTSASDAEDGERPCADLLDAAGAPRFFWERRHVGVKRSPAAPGMSRDPLASGAQPGVSPQRCSGGWGKGKASCRLPNAPCLFHGVMPVQGDLRFNLARGWGPPSRCLPQTHCDPPLQSHGRDERYQLMWSHLKKKIKEQRRISLSFFFVCFLIFYLLCAHG